MGQYQDIWEINFNDKKNNFLGNQMQRQIYPPEWEGTPASVSPKAMINAKRLGDMSTGPRRISYSDKF